MDGTARLVRGQVKTARAVQNSDVEPTHPTNLRELLIVHHHGWVTFKTSDPGWYL